MTGGAPAGCRAMLEGRDAPLSEDEGYALLSDYGIRVPPHRVVESRAEAIRAADEIGFPLVAKTATPGILHKSDVGGLGRDIEQPRSDPQRPDGLPECAGIGRPRPDAGSGP